MKKQICIYFTIGLLNTAIHWSVFIVVYSQINVQSSSNLTGFLIAATFSYIINSKYNFNSNINKSKYIFFIMGMGFINYSVGYTSDYFSALPLLTLISSSGLSFIIGFAFSKYIVFR
ncbi:GtrA family protein [Vibrio natriegens]|uniref:GtrA family protein n=1 Tax=Vibrio natriegens TaxID=691 RepID=UPI003DA0F97C